jgi:hypothetical protein
MAGVDIMIAEIIVIAATAAINPSTACLIAEESAKARVLRAERILGAGILDCRGGKCTGARQIWSVKDSVWIKTIDRKYFVHGNSCTARLKVQIVPIKSPKIETSTRINRHVFQEGDKVFVYVETGELIYVTLFNRMNNGYVKIFPNKFDKNDRVDNVKRIPTKKGYSLKIKLGAEPFPHRFALVLSRERIRFKNLYTEGELFHAVSGRAKLIFHPYEVKP